MPLKVWILRKGYHYEGSSNMGVFDTFDKAKTKLEAMRAALVDEGNWSEPEIEGEKHFYTESDMIWLAINEHDVE